MYLLIDGGEKNNITFVFFTEKMQERKSYARSNREMLQSLEEALTSLNKKQSDIAGIAIVLGVGSFSGTRVATTIANSFAYARDIPVVGITSTEAEDLFGVKEKISSAKKGEYVSALYSAEPHIG